MRLGLAQAWRILVAVEMLAAVPWGLGWLIFGARKFLNTDTMMAGIVVIALIGLALEKFVFQKIENYTVVRWGMISSSRNQDHAGAPLYAVRCLCLLQRPPMRLSRAAVTSHRHCCRRCRQSRTRCLPDSQMAA